MQELATTTGAPKAHAWDLERRKQGTLVEAAARTGEGWRVTPKATFGTVEQRSTAPSGDGHPNVSLRCDDMGSRAVHLSGAALAGEWPRQLGEKSHGDHRRPQTSESAPLQHVHAPLSGRREQ